MTARFLRVLDLILLGVAVITAIRAVRILAGVAGGGSTEPVLLAIVGLLLLFLSIGLASFAAADFGWFPSLPWPVGAAIFAVPAALILLGAVAYSIIHPELFAGSQTQVRPGRDNVLVFLKIWPAIAAIGMAAQLYYTTRRGYVVCGPSDRVGRDQQPRLYLLWGSIHIVFILILAGASVVLSRF
jgi:hypothetical protein